MPTKEMTNVAKFQGIVLLAVSTGLVPEGFCVGVKSDFWYHSAINWLLNIVYPKKKDDSYLKRFWTTIWKSIGGPDSEAKAQHPITPDTTFLLKHGLFKSATALKLEAWWILLHEIMHVLQAKKWTPALFSFLYLFPLSLGGLLILTCWLPVLWASGWHLAVWIPVWVILGGVCFIPQIPDPWRTHWEMEAYAINLYTYYLRYGTIHEAYIQSRVENFTSMQYYMMEPRRDRVYKKLKAVADSIMDGTFKPNERQTKVIQLLKRVELNA